MPRHIEPIEARFWSKVEKADGCWKWRGAKSQGYGYLTLGGRGAGLMRAHRLSYTIHHGEIPDGLLVRHKCDNPECTNPDHLDVGTSAENSMDIVKRRRHHRHSQTHCKMGHEFTPENTKINKNGHRSCKECKNEGERKKRRKVRGAMFGVPVWTPKTHCPHGHEFTDENTYTRPDGYRECRTCRVNRMERFNRGKMG
jgi:hypothetical protein